MSHTELQMDVRRSAASSNSYLSPKCYVRIAEEKGGYAVFAAQAIAKGELLVMWSGTLVDGAKLETLSDGFRRHSLQVEEDLFLVSLTESEPADYVNHSCSPNAGLSGQISLVAMRDIRAGEEITYDYAMSDGSDYDEFPCSCGASECRGHVGGKDWRNEALWTRYGGYFSPYLSQRIVRLKNMRRAQLRRARLDSVGKAASLLTT